MQNAWVIRKKDKLKIHQIQKCVKCFVNILPLPVGKLSKHKHVSVYCEKPVDELK